MPAKKRALQCIYTSNDVNNTLAIFGILIIPKVAAGHMHFMLSADIYGSETIVTLYLLVLVESYLKDMVWHIHF